jgi:K+-sensing histidine kinase KdpD
VTRDEHVWSAAEMEFLSTLAGQAAMAMDRAQLHDQRRRIAAQLRAAERVNDDFLKSCSTNLKTPLTVVTGYTDMFRAGSLGKVTPIQEQAIEAMERQAKLLQGSIEALLSVSHFAAEAVYVEAHDLSLWELFSELRAAYDSRPAKHAKLIWDYPIDLPEVRSYRGKLKQVVASSIDNALEVMDRGKISIAVRYLSAAQVIEVRIANGGAGKAVGQCTTEFEPSQPAPSVDGSGFALGLFVVKKYIELLGGTIAVESTLTAGSTFILQLPAPIAQSSMGQQQLKLAAEGNN